MTIIKIIIDDTFQTISEWNGKNRIGSVLLNGSNSPYNFETIVSEVLTTSQYKEYVETDTKRVFAVSDKRFGYLMDYTHNRK